MSKNIHRRGYLRSPLKTTFLYVDDGHVFKGKINNISEGGVLLGEMPHIPDEKLFSILIDLPKFPEFSKYSLKKMMFLDADNLEREIIKAEVKIIRTFDGISEVERIFINNIGGEFSIISARDREKISKYVTTYAKNIVYLLGYFEIGMKKKEHLDLVRSLLFLMGYNGREKISILREKLLHDYQSLESL